MARKKTTVAKTASPARAVDQQLARYRAMRDFKATAEPSGEGAGRPAKKKTALPFVVQKHAASHLHYDFRLGWNGVLKSWAVAKGPSYFPGDKRLAVEVEDHPIEYGGFEGIIPQGQYGGGTVMVWDHGTWEPHGDVDDGLKRGSLKFTLHGEKLKGDWALVRMGGKAANERKPNWLLIKEHDEFERGAKAKPITEEAPNSVVTGRDLEAIAGQEDHVWESNKSREKQPAARKQSVRKSKEQTSKGTKQDFAAELRGVPKERMPAFVPPQLAMQTNAPPEGSGWLHELKLDGYRIQAHIQQEGKGFTKLLTRSGQDWTHRMPAVVDELAVLPVKSAVLDGEVVVLDDNGLSNFSELQAAFQEHAKKPLTYFVFDLLHLNGHNLRNLPLSERKRLLAELLSRNSGDTVRLSEHLEASAEKVFDKACELGAEGIVSKHVADKYLSGRSSGWLKRKCYREQELVIGGFTLPSNGTNGVGALLLGYYSAGKLVYAGRTGTGFTQKTHRMMRERLDALQQKSSPFAKVPAQATRGVHWVKPALVAQISFAEWTADNQVRQAAFKGLREDKPAKEVRKEEAIRLRKAPEKASASRRHLPVAAKASSATAKKFEENEAQIRLTHPEKILDAESGLTKQQLANYYFAVAKHMLPYIVERPLSLVRCPEGTGKPCFYQKHVTDTMPEGIESVSIRDKKSGKPEPYITLSTAKALAGLAQMGVLEVHPWGSRNQSLDKPDRIVFDLDPDVAIDWKTLSTAALEIRKRLKKQGLESFLKTTGGKGLHVVVPIQAEHDWDEVKPWTHAFVLEMERENPELYLTKMTKSARKGKIFLDYLRNERGATSVAPFSPRARPGMPVSLPLSWSELKGKQRPEFRVADFATWRKRLSSDPWKKITTLQQQLNLK